MRFVAVVFCQVLVSMAFAQETIKLEDGTTVYGFKSKPPIETPKECPNGYALVKSSEKYEILPDGLKKLPSKSVIMVNSGCIYPKTGTLQIDSGKRIDFYQENVFSENGEMVFWANTMNPIPDGRYRSKKGTQFSVKMGYVENLGYFCTGDVCFENRD